MAQAAARLGQDLFYPPNVKGWDGGEAWINANSLLLRYNMPASLIFAAADAAENPMEGEMMSMEEMMRGGQSELAISPYCGTNLATGLLLATIISNLVLKRSKSRILKVPLAILTFMGAMALGRPLGNALQRRYTTLAEMENFQINGITSFSFGSFAIHRVRTESR